MARYIDAEVLAERLLNAWNTADENKRADIMQIMANIVTPILVSTPTVDVVEVKHGKWIEKESCVYQCSECGFQFTSADDICQFKYCRCGAKMDGNDINVGSNGGNRNGLYGKIR